MKKNLFKVLFVLILIFSLGLNILLLYDKMNTKKDDIVIEEDTKKTIDKEITYKKDLLGKLFKDYQIESKNANSDNYAILEVEKITNVGYFKSDNNKKLYYIDEKYSCLEGTNCVTPVGEVKTDDKLNNYTTFVVMVTPVDSENAKFEILDYSIEKSDDFVKVKHEVLK